MATSIQGLKGEYTAGVLYDGLKLIRYAEKIDNTGFMGSDHLVALMSSDSIIHDSPACIAAPIVNMVARRSLSLGMGVSESTLDPVVRLYVPDVLFLSAPRILIGDIAFIVPPKTGIVNCEKLVLSKIEVEPPDYWELIESWVVGDAVEIEKV